MDRRRFLGAAACGTAALAAGGPASAAPAGEERAPAGRLLADDYTVVTESPDPQRVFTYSPGLCRLPGGRLVATCDLGGPGVRELPGAVRGGKLFAGRIFTSDDHGRTWQQRAETPMIHARPFIAGESVYVLGHSGDLQVVRSRDGGTTWSDAVALTQGQRWHQAPCNVHTTRGNVYLVMERQMDPAPKGWAVASLAPVLLAGRVDDDLTRREAWRFATELSFRDAVAQAGAPHLLGVPFFTPGNTAPDNAADKRNMAPPGWLETNVVQFTDPSHVWHDPRGRTFHLWARAHTGSVNLACIAKVVEEDGRMVTSLERAPSGEPILYVPCPGGQMKFHIVYDEGSKLFWLLSTQATDSMVRPEAMPAERYNLPNNERQRLALHFSHNCIDWCFAGLVAVGKGIRQSRHYASMAIDGDDLHVLSRSGDARAKDPHNGNVITFHTVRGFRRLVY